VSVDSVLDFQLMAAVADDELCGNEKMNNYSNERGN
jgi:hypothetical protein